MRAMSIGTAHENGILIIVASMRQLAPRQSSGGISIGHCASNRGVGLKVVPHSITPVALARLNV
jgi:hypothetical protein